MSLLPDYEYPEAVLSHIKIRRGQTERAKMLHGKITTSNLLPTSLGNRFQFRIIMLLFPINAQSAFRNIIENFRHFARHIGSRREASAQLLLLKKLPPPNSSASARDNKFR